MRVTLVDHNSLADTQLHLGKFVTGIVDHHHDDGLFVQANPRVVERVGSCATLVTEMCCVKGDMDRDIAMLLLCAILIDCNNLSEGGKATVRDREQAHMLCCLLCMSEKERDELYAKLKFLRRDMEGFSVRDLLERDTKKVSTEAVRIAVASVPLSSESLAGRAGGWERLGEEVGMYAREEEVDCMVLMCGYSDDGVHRRDLLVCNGMGDIARKVAADLERREELKLDCVEGDWGMLRYWQRNVKASRKVVLPALRDVVRELR